MPNMSDEFYLKKYLKYKEKYLKLKSLRKTLQNGGNKCHLCKNNKICTHQ